MTNHVVHDPIPTLGRVAVGAAAGVVLVTLLTAAFCILLRHVPPIDPNGLRLIAATAVLGAGLGAFFGAVVPGGPHRRVAWYLLMGVLMAAVAWNTARASSLSPPLWGRRPGIVAVLFGGVIGTLMGGVVEAIASRKPLRIKRRPRPCGASGWGLEMARGCPLRHLSVADRRPAGQAPRPRQGALASPG